MKGKAIVSFFLALFLISSFLVGSVHIVSASPRPETWGPLISTAQTETTVTLSWGQSEDVYFYSYTLWFSSTGVNGPYSDIWSTGNKGQTSLGVTGLVSNTNYWFYVEDQGFLVDYRSNTLQVTTASNPWLWVAGSDNTSATLAWYDYNTLPYSSFEPFVSYILQVSTSGPGGPWSTCASMNDPSQNSFIQMGLSATAGYWFQLYDIAGQPGNTFRSYSNIVVVPPRTFSVSVSPSSATIDIGQSQLFNSTVSGGTPPYSYQWGWYDEYGGPEVTQTNTTWSGACAPLASASGSTDSTWTFTPGWESTFGVWVVVTDNAGFVAYSNLATVIVDSIPSVAISPSSPVMDIGQSQLVTSNVTGGTPPYSYGWYVGDQLINFHTTPLTVNAFGRIGGSPNPFASPGSYTVYLNVTDSVGANAISNNVSITVNPAPSASISPASVNLDVGQPQTFNSSVSNGTSPYTYQWYLYLPTFGSPVPFSIPGATASNWTFTPTSSGVYTFYLNVTDSVGVIAISNNATVTVSAPSVTISPTSSSPLVMDVGQSKQFTSNVSGGASPYAYQWYLNDVAVSGATSDIWTFTPGSSGSYSVYLNVTDNVGFRAKSNITLLTVNPMLSVNISPTSATLQVGQSQLFTSNVTGGTSSYSYQWYSNGDPVPGASNPTWTFTLSSTGSHLIYVKVIDSVGFEAASNNATITVAPRVDIAVINVTSYTTVVSQDDSMNVDVTTANQGDSIETFNLTAYANATIIGSQNITLPSGNSTTVTFTWNTTGFVEGNYIISAYAWPIPGETQITNNTYVDGTVQIVLPTSGGGGGRMPYMD